jgi:PKHD-type hydroxylase
VPHPALRHLSDWSPVVFGERAFTAADCEAILSLQRDVKDAAIQAGDGGAPYRKGRVCWLRPGAETNWIFAKALEHIQRVNAKTYKMDLAGFTEPLQLAEYMAGEHYDWHLDLGRDGYSVRKLSFIVQLTQEGAYEGGAVEVLATRTPQAMPKAQGAMIVFPAYVLHRVNPVTRGARRSLVGWIGGPPFR